MANRTDEQERKKRQDRARARRYYRRHKRTIAIRRRETRVSRKACERTALQEIGEAKTYTAFIDVLVRRRRALNLSQADVDELAGLAAGHTGKIEASRAPRAGVRGYRSPGFVSLGRLLEALALKVVFVEDGEPPATDEHRGGWKRES